MRTRYLVSLTLLLFPAFLLSVRHHIRDLYEVARTYSTFHPYLRRHDDVLFRFPTPFERQEQVGSMALPEHVPKIMHQIFLSDGKPNATLRKYEPAIASCKTLHPDWTFYMWNDEEGRAFMAAHYPQIAPHYVGYKQNIQRANILRYALLHHYGGVYVDLDVTCRASLDTPLVEGNPETALTHLPLLTPGAYPAGVNNAFILSRPQHPFLAELLDRVPSRDLSWPMPYVENMLSTGCMYFSNVWTAYSRHLARAKDVAKEDRVYIIADENGDMESHMLRGKVVTPLFEHGGASSWHGWDAAMIVLVGKHYGYFALLLAAVVGLGGYVTWRMTRRGGRPKLRRPSSWRGALSRFSFEKRAFQEKHRLLDDEEQGL